MPRAMFLHTEADIRLKLKNSEGMVRQSKLSLFNILPILAYTYTDQRCSSSSFAQIGDKICMLLLTSDAPGPKLNSVKRFLNSYRHSRDKILLVNLISEKDGQTMIEAILRSADCNRQYSCYYEKFNLKFTSNHKI